MNTLTSPDMHMSLQNALDQALVFDGAVHGGVLTVATAEDRVALATGLADPRHSRRMRPDDQFHAASITKMITATTAMLLVEDGLLDLDRGIGAYLPAATIAGLHRHGGQVYENRLTMRQLLSHTSGVADCFGDGPPDASGNSPFMAALLAEPDRLWQPHEVLAWTRRNLSARFAPGGGWHYSDTGYVLAGLVIERVAGDKLHDVMRSRLFARLGMHSTYMLYREARRPANAARPVSMPAVGDIAYGAMRATSADWASGGLVTNAADLTLFMRAFAEKRIFKNDACRRQMLPWIETGERGVFYGLGLRRFDLSALGLPGYGGLWGHTGFLKAFALYWPAMDVTICGTLNQSRARGVFSQLRPVAELVPAVLRLLDADQPMKGGMLHKG